MEFCLKEQLDEIDTLKHINKGKERILILKDKENWQVIEFVFFQFGTLREDCRPHKQISDLIKKHKNIGYKYPIGRVQDKDKEQDKDKDKDKDIRKKHSFKKSPYYEFKAFREALKEWSVNKVDYYYERAKGYSEANGGRYLNWAKAVRNWDRDKPYGVNKNDKITC